MGSDCGAKWVKSLSSQEHFPRQDRLWITDLSDTAGAEFWPAHLGQGKIEELLEVEWNEGEFNQRKCQTYGTLRHAVLLFSFNPWQLVVKCRMLCSISLLNKPSQKWEPPQLLTRSWPSNNHHNCQLRWLWVVSKAMVVERFLES